MTQMNTTWIEASVVENEVHMSIVELSHAARTPQELIMSWVSEGVLSPLGSSPEDWRFSGDSLRRAKTAAHLTHDLELNVPGVALALDLLDEIAQLRSRLLRES
ncbi:chaperone modulator CbpM [Polynucleobacter sp. MWH-Svant-W18]|jgi:chaperone modulatory protein CbpM|uniref:chaperone modulator CbpM n=1 Tax=Polynucleobacter sp. MWH-Svant-W18 TaxID=1855909 RepID=UPI001BFE82C3|nr:chaperone modulator CbpM [Polynucleobacter sp. MWH-Svant-W18]QWD77417.1 MerR family transcriptional regulator [Polynucleobacter sp. MWH-Svant-W18]